MTNWWVPSLWHSVTILLKNPGYPPGFHDCQILCLKDMPYISIFLGAEYQLAHRPVFCSSCWRLWLIHYWHYFTILSLWFPIYEYATNSIVLCSCFDISNFSRRSESRYWLQLSVLSGWQDLWTLTDQNCFDVWLLGWDANRSYCSSEGSPTIVVLTFCLCFAFCFIMSFYIFILYLGYVCIRAKWSVRPVLVSAFCGMERLGIFLLPPGWDTGLS